jgi:hypothetical protein
MGDAMTRSRSVSDDPGKVPAGSEHKIEQPQQAEPRDYCEVLAATFLTVVKTQYGQDTMLDDPMVYQIKLLEQLLKEVAQPPDATRNDPQ